MEVRIASHSGPGMALQAPPQPGRMIMQNVAKLTDEDA